VVRGEGNGPVFVLPPEAEVEDQVDRAGRIAATRTAASSQDVG
jgi:hypothetical protein